MTLGENSVNHNVSHDVRRDQSNDFLAVITPFLVDWAKGRVSEENPC